MSRKVEKVVETRELDIPEEELEEYREAFNLFDKDGSGSISPDEFIKVLKNLGQKVTKEEAFKICADLDQDGSGSVEFEEFVSYMKKIKIQQEEEEARENIEDEVIRAFRTFDKNQDGTISKDEFRYILCKLGDEQNRFTQEECDEIFREADIDNDGQLDYKEFVNYWRNK
jgi:calmodulin